MADLTECMYVASRPISIGKFNFGPGDEITIEAIRALPPRRLEQLVRQNWLDRLPVPG